MCSPAVASYLSWGRFTPQQMVSAPIQHPSFRLMTCMLPLQLYATIVHALLHALLVLSCAHALLCSLKVCLDVLAADCKVCQQADTVHRAGLRGQSG